MKLKVTQKFRDTENDEIINKGETIERTKKRGKQIIDRGVAEEVKEKKSKKDS